MYNYFLFLKKTLFYFYFLGVESTNAMSQDIGCVTRRSRVCPGVTCTEDCAPPYYQLLVWEFP